MKAKPHVLSQSIKQLLNVLWHILMEFIHQVSSVSSCSLFVFLLNHNKARSSHIKNKTKTNTQTQDHFPEASAGQRQSEVSSQMLGTQSSVSSPHRSGTSSSAPGTTFASPRAAGHTPSRRQHFHSPVQPT